MKKQFGIQVEKIMVKDILKMIILIVKMTAEKKKNIFM